MASRICFALVGTGRIGRTHFKNLLLSERSSIKYVVEEDTKSAKEFLSRYQMEDKLAVLQADKMEQVYDDPDVKAVMVCSPSATHESFVKQSLEAGKSVFCEKPLALTISAVHSCYDVAERVKLPLFVAFQRRFDPQLNKMWNLIREGKIGDVRLVRSTSRDPPGMITKEYLQASGGIFVDSAVHDIDMVNWLVGETPESVYAAGVAWGPLWREVGDVDTSAALLRYPGGAIASLDISRNVPSGYDQRVESFGTGGTLQSHNRKPMDFDYRTMEGVQSPPIYEDFMQRYDVAYARELDHFLNVVEGKEECSVTRSSTVGVNLVAEACSESVKTGQVVNIKDIAAKYT